MTKDYLIRIADAIEVVKDTMKRLVDDEPRGDSDTLTEYCAKLAKLTSINDEILKALSALPSAEADWIPCSERLPNVGEDVLFCDSEWTQEGCVMEDGDWWQFRWSTVRKKEDVTAWMPLPKPYREDGKEYELATEQMEHDALYEPTYNSEDGSM